MNFEDFGAGEKQEDQLNKILQKLMAIRYLPQRFQKKELIAIIGASFKIGRGPPR